MILSCGMTSFGAGPVKQTEVLIHIIRHPVVGMTASSFAGAMNL